MGKQSTSPGCQWQDLLMHLIGGNISLRSRKPPVVTPALHTAVGASAGATPGMAQGEEEGGGMPRAQYWPVMPLCGRCTVLYTSAIPSCQLSNSGHSMKGYFACPECFREFIVLKYLLGQTATLIVEAVCTFTYVRPIVFGLFYCYHSDLFFTVLNLALVSV